MAANRTNDIDNNDNSTEPICAICLAPYTGRVYLSPCLHSFCASCLSAWVEVSVLCPLCKSKTEKIHWGVDTALGVVHTITVRTSSPFYSLDGSGSGSRGMPWRDALKNAAAQARQQEQEQEQEKDDRHEGNVAEKYTATDTSSSASESEDENTQATRRQDRNSVGSSNKRSRSRSASQSQSRSRSTTPIDSHPYLYDSGELFSPHSASLGQLQRVALATETASTADKRARQSDLEAETNSAPAVVVARIPSRQEVYAVGMEPHPEQDFLLADEIRPIDMTFLTPFLHQDLVVLTNSGTRPLEPIILDLITSLFVMHGGKALSPSRGVGVHVQKRQALGTKSTRPQQPPQQADLTDWSAIEQEVAQWIALTPSKENWNELDMARLFVREMRRIVKRRWTVKRWNNAVLYKPMSPAS
ncbi:hypothetical protein BGW39_011342 [Mortierella sp. 14UC]|nr:hypothetical protein BGW39_011342 [Mortierella sp. 14UC]